MKHSLSGLALVFVVSACSKQGESPRAEASAIASAEASAIASAPPPPGGSVSGTQAPGLIEVSGEELLRAVVELGGKGTIVNAWASWCGPCRREMPMLLGMADELRSRGVNVMLVSVDEPDAHPAAVQFLEGLKAPLPSFVARRPLGPFKRALNPRWPGMLPATFLYDAAGKLRYFWGGPVYEEELSPVVDQFLAGTLVDGEARFGLAPGKVER